MNPYLFSKCFSLVEILSENDPTHAYAYWLVQNRHADEARVVTTTGHVLFRAWKVANSKTFAWKTSTMAAPAFAPFADEEAG